MLPPSINLPKLSALSLAIVTALNLNAANATDYLIQTDGSTITLNGVDTLTVEAGNTITGSADTWTYGVISNYTSTNTINNAGTIQATLGSPYNYGIINRADDPMSPTQSGTITSLINTGIIQASSSASYNWGIYNQQTANIGTLYNSGAIAGTTSNSFGWGIENRGTINSITNAQTGAIYGTSSFYGVGVVNKGWITTLTNMGTIDGTTYDIQNTTDSNIPGGGVISTLINAQGAGDALIFSGNIPSTYKIFINSTSDYGQLIVKDSTWDFNNLTFDIADNSVVEATTYQDVIIQGSSTTFTNTTDKSGSYFDGSLSWDWTLQFDSLNWDLLVTNGIGPAPLTDAAQSTNTLVILPAAKVLESSSTLLSQFTGTDQELADKVESVLPGMTGGVSQLTQTTTQALTHLVSTHQDSGRGLAAGDGFITNRHFWLKPFGGWTEQDDTQGVTGYDIDSYGLAIGVDGDVSESWNVGLAFAYIDSDVKSNLTAGKHNIDMDSYLAKVYATMLIDDVTSLNIQLGAGISDYDSKRLIFTGDVAQADYDSWNVQASAELQRSYEVTNAVFLTPYVRADYGYVNVEDYRESGAGALNLNVNADSSDSLVLSTGLKASHRASESLNVFANAGIGYDIMTDRSSLTSSFAGGGAQFTTEGIEPEQWVYNAGLGAKYSLENGAEITASYNLDARQDYTDQSVSANVRLMF
jgi:outer membrane autotransporter protein